MSASRKKAILRSGSVVLFVFAGGVGGASSKAAEDGSYVMANGRKIRLAKSATEYGVTLHRCEDAEECAKRLADQGAGTLKSIALAPRARVKIVEVEGATPERRKALRQDPAIEDVRPIYRFETSDTPVMGTGTAVAKLRRGLSDAERVAIWQQYGVAMATPVRGQPDVYLITPFDDDEEVALAESLGGDPRVRWAQPNLRRPATPQQVIPVDPFYGLQWHLNNTGQLGGSVGSDIDAPEAWEISTGEGVLFGIFDTGCDVDHEDLRDNYIGFGQDASLEAGFEGSENPRPKVFGDSHATPVIGLAVASANRLGGRGVAYEAKFTASRGLTEAGEFGLSDVQIAKAFNFARESNVDVHINSWRFFDLPIAEVVVDIIGLSFREGRNKGDLDGDGDDDPLGMVIVFGAGNDSFELQPGLHIAGLQSVIGVGATTDFDELAGYSNYGSGVEVLAPGGERFAALLLTTDNTDSAAAVDAGLNVGGTFAGSNVREPDSEGKYTRFFNGTSAACPIVAGVAGLILSANPMLTATDVRLILEHTAERVNPLEADYHGITSRSVRYAHGRVNAGGAGDKIGAVEAARETVSNGGYTWPDRAADVRVEGVFLRWRQNYGTSDFLVVSSDEEFAFIPEDGVCYDPQQENCGGDVRSLPAGVQVLAAGCGMSCDPLAPSLCETGSEQCVAFPTPEAGQTRFFGIYALNPLGRYSFGVAADSTGDVLDSGTVVGEESGGSSDTSPPPPQGPAVTISVSPLQGKSPLVVQFSGNAVSDIPVDESRTIWDFDVDDGIPVNATTRTGTHTYFVPAGEDRVFTCRLTMFDTAGNAGFAEAGIRVEGAEVADDGEGSSTSTADMRIIIGLPNTPGSDVDEGTSPFSVLLSVDADDLQATVQSVSWDLGDGGRATSLVVPHTYVNNGQVVMRLPITATLIGVTPGGTTVSRTVTRIITINPGLPVVNPGDPDLPGTGTHGEGGAAVPCSVGVLPLFLIVLGLTSLRRRGWAT